VIVHANEASRRALAHLADPWSLGAVVQAASEDEALDILRREATRASPIDWVVADAKSPDALPVGLARAIAREPALARTRLIALTSGGPLAHAQGPGAAGIDAVLRKPVKQISLLRCLTQLADGGPSGPSAPIGSSLVAAAGGDSDAAATAGGTGASVTAAHPTSPHTVDPTASQGGGALRVLLAEDNRVNQLVALKLLEKLGHRVVVAATGLEALQALQDAPFDVIIMDCQMPELDGYETTQRIRRGEAGDPGIPIIAMTAHAMTGDRERCLQAGMSDYVAKPVSAQGFRLALARVMAACKPALASDAPPEPIDLLLPHPPTAAPAEGRTRAALGPKPVVTSQSPGARVQACSAADHGLVPTSP
jgi:CheY-like chemotaxis protein